MLKIAVLVSGGGTNLQAIIDQIEKGNITDTSIEAVVSNRKKAYALDRAAKYGINHQCISPKEYENKEKYTDALIAYLEEKDIDLVVLAGFLVILHEKFTTRFKHRIINIHPSLIPSFAGDGYYGLRVHEAALKRGVKVTGATVHIVDEITDHGPILYQKAVSVREDDTPESLQQRVMEEAEWLLLPQAINEFHIWFPKLEQMTKE